MSGRNKRTNPVLLILVVLMCLGCGFLFTQSSSTPSPIRSSRLPDMFVVSKEERTSNSRAKTDSSSTDETKEEKANKEPEKKVQEEKYVFEVSPEAEKGVWTSSGSNWIFLVEGEPYAGGWLNDTDGKRYYFGEDGIMKTGLIQADGQSYYLDLDGIMQTGDITIDGKDYHFFPDGTMQTKEHSKMDPVPTEAPEQIEKADSSKTEEAEAEKAAKAEKAKEAKAETAKATTAEPAKAAETEAAKSGEKEKAAEAEKSVKTEKEAEAEKSAETEKEAEAETSEKSKAKSAKAAEAEPAKNSDSEKKETKRIALTFDDGPGEYTDRLLDCLEKNGVKATFFMTGNHITAYPDTVIRMDQLGCEIGNHTYTHPNYADLNQTDGSAEIDGTNEVLASLIGRGAGLFRPPYGLADDLVLSCTGLPVILWTSEIPAEEGKTADSITEEVLSCAEDGAILLLYDTDGTTVEAAESFIPKLLSEGYELLTVSELAEANKVTLQGKTVYDFLEK